MRHLILVVVLAATVVGCARAGQNPTVPVAPGGDQGAHAPRLHSELTDPAALAVERGAPYRLLGEYTFFISAEHDRVDVVPRRDPHFHLNALKFLEEYCKDCLQITGIKNNGDGTIDLTVRITHPFKGFPQYTGFDVKGIIMFQGSYEYQVVWTKEPPYPDPYRISWRLMGDPELLNPDGWTMRWSPSWVSGSTKPIFNYWPGKYSIGTPTANLNGFRNFYTDEERHMFATGGSVQRVYTIWLPPGEPVVAGYAVEACWEPPTVMPVTDPLVDFPISANQPEPYLFNFVVNDNQPITKSPCCGHSDCNELRVELARWDGVIPGGWPDGNTYIYRLLWNGTYLGMGCVWECSPPQEDAYYINGHDFTMDGTDGIYRQIAWYCQPPTLYPTRVALDVFDFVVDLQ